MSSTSPEQTTTAHMNHFAHRIINSDVTKRNCPPGCTASCVKSGVPPRNPSTPWRIHRKDTFIRLICIFALMNILCGTKLTPSLDICHLSMSGYFQSQGRLNRADSIFLTQYSGRSRWITSVEFRNIVYQPPTSFL